MARTRKRNPRIPDVVGEQYRALEAWESRHACRSYLSALHNAGWTHVAIGESIGVSRERVRQQIAAAGDAAESLDEYRLITGLELPIPPLPTYPEKPRKRIVRPVPEDVAVILRTLHAQAVRYRGVESNRAAAVAFTALVWSLHSEHGYAINQISKAVGVNHAALQTRLVRYGYKTSSGESMSYRPLIGRGFRRALVTHCKRGHEFTPDNTYVYKNGSRFCRACQNIRSKAYQERKKNAAHT